MMRRIWVVTLAVALVATTLPTSLFAEETRTQADHNQLARIADGMKASEVIAALGAKAMEGAFGTAPQGLGEAAAAFRKAYDAKHKDAPKPYVDAAYDAAVLIGLAALRAKSSQPKMIRDSLRAVANPPGEKVLPGEFAKAKKLIEAGQDIDYVGAAGPQNFDAAGDVTGSYAHWEIKGGAFVTIKVFEVK